MAKTGLQRADGEAPAPRAAATPRATPPPLNPDLPAGQPLGALTREPHAGSGALLDRLAAPESDTGAATAVRMFGAEERADGGSQPAAADGGAPAIMDQDVQPSAAAAPLQGGAPSLQLKHLQLQGQPAVQQLAAAAHVRPEAVAAEQPPVPSPAAPPTAPAAPQPLPVATSVAAPPPKERRWWQLTRAKAEDVGRRPLLAAPYDPSRARDDNLQLSITICAHSVSTFLSSNFPCLFLFYLL